MHRPLPNREIAPLATKPDFERGMERVEAWYHQAVLDRPPVRFYAHNVQYETGQPLDRGRWASLEERWFDTDYQIEAFERAMARKVFRAETFPVFVPKLGPSIYSAFYGGRLEFGEVTSWFHPIVENLDDLSGLRSEPFDNVYFRKMEEITRAALARCGGRYWVGYPDLHPSLDCVAAWCGTEALFLAMATEPEKLVSLLDLSVRDFDRIFGHFDELLRRARQPSVTWINLPCRGRFHVPSSDTSSMLSTEYFNRFALPLLRREMTGMDRAVYHVDGKGVAQHLDVILAQPDIQAIQWVQGVGTDWPILQWIPLLQRVLAAGRSVMVDVPMAELEEFIARMPREGIYLCLGVDDADQERVLERISRW
jgi:hypothetical protein